MKIPKWSPFQLRTLLLRRFSSSPISQSHRHLFPQFTNPNSSIFSNLFQDPTKTTIITPRSLSFPIYSNSFCSNSNPAQETQEIAELLSAELLKIPDGDTLSLSQRLDLGFSHIILSPALILRTLDISANAGRTALDFQKWISSKSDFKHTDETISYFVEFFGRRKDFKAMHDVLVDGRGNLGSKTLECSIDRMVRAGRPTQVVSFFEKMDQDYGFVRNRDSLKLVVEKLCEHGFAGYAEKMVNGLAKEFFPDEYICDLLIKGWCVGGKLDEARRLAGEMHRGGFDLGSVAYNSILDCVCKLCRKKDPFRLQSEAELVLIDMDVAGVPRNVETFNVLITNLCKIRKTEDALNLFDRMGEWGCYPNETTFLVLIKSLYQAARIGEGDEMIDRMKSAGFGKALNKKEYFEFLTILCGTERIDHALSVFAKMKEDGCVPGIKTYDLLMEKLSARGNVDKANVLFKEADSNGVPVVQKAYKLDPRFIKKPEVKKEKKRETLPEKMAKKRSRLKKIRLSFVKPARKGMR